MSNGKAEWLFIKEDPNDRVRATVRRHALGGSSLSHEARVVREAIQNSVDATIEDEKTDVLVWNRAVSGNEIEEFRAQIGFDDADSPFTRLDSLGLQPGNAIEQMSSTDTSERRFNVTIIEDRKTCGLGFDDIERIDRFDELCLSYGQDATTVEANRGGSYGFGKSVYDEASDCSIFIVYSVFKPNSDSAPNEAGSHARLFACATFQGHTLGGTKYRGRALFGVLKDSDSLVECRPIVDEDAHEIARRLGFIRRSPEDTGTSIMIVGSSVDTATLKEAIENYWWPRLYSNLLSVELWDDNVEAEHPDPKTNEDLRPFLRCYSLIEEGIAKSESERVHPFRTNEPLTQQGKLALTPLPELEDGEDESEQDSYLESTVALIRSGPRMVVNYLNPGGRSTANFVGVFVSHPDVEEYLHLSEPSAHDSWSPESTRFAEYYPDSPEMQVQGRRTVRSILSKIKDQSRSYRRGLVQTTPPRTVTGSRTLQNILGEIMSGNTQGPRLIPRKEYTDPFTINIRTVRQNAADMSRVMANVSVSLNERAPRDEANATLTIEPYLTIDDDNKRDSQSVLSLQEVKIDGEPIECDENRIPTTIRKGMNTNIEIVSGDFPRDLYAGLDVDVKVDEFESDSSSGNGADQI